MAFRERLAAQDPAGRMHADMRCSRDPCVDFFEYACGAVARRADWNARQDAFGLQARTNSWLIWNIAQVAVNDTKGAERRRIADFWQACESKFDRDRDGVEPLRPLIEAIDAIDGPRALASALALLHGQGIPALFALGVTLDDERTHHVAVLGPGATGLHTGFYLAEDRKTLVKYRDFVASLTWRALGKRVDVDALLTVERAIARARLAMGERDDAAVPLSGAPPALPGFDWATYDAGFDERLRRRRYDPAYFEVLARELDLAGDLAPIQEYLRFTLVDQLAPDLSPDIALHSARFYADLGYPFAAPVGWRACTERLERYLPDLLTHYYINLTQDAAQVRQVAELALELHGYFMRRIAGATWLSPGARQAAQEKIAGLQIFLGHHGALDDYADVALDAQHHLSNVVRLRSRAFARAVEKIGAPATSRVPPGEPFTTNAWYSTAHNAAMIPQALLAPPYYDDAAPTPFLYGRLGSTIGHEIGHALAGDARRYDARERPRSWWAEADDEAYAARAQCFVDDFDGMIVDRGYRVDGERTLTENLADHAGLRTAWEAFEARERERLDVSPEIAGVTNAQAFFLAWSQGMCGVPSEMSVHDQDAHAPGRARVNGTLRNFPPFAVAFGCAEGEPMARGAASCSLW